MKNTEKSANRHFKRLIRTGGAITAAFAFAALLGWIAGFPFLSTLESGRVPMAPSTALLFLIFGGLLFFHESALQSRGKRWIAIAFGSSAVFASLILFILSSMGIQPKLEHLGLDIEGMVNGVPIGHISPLTAFCFILAGISFLLPFSSSPRQWRIKTSFWLSAVISIISIILVLAYFFRGPLLYSSNIIPPALTTSCAFLALGISLILYSGVRIRSVTPQTDIGSIRASYSLIILFLIFSAIIITLSYFYFQKYRQHIKAEVESELTAVAELKINDLTQWRRERLGDASVFFDNDNFSGLAARFLERPGDKELQGRIRIWLSKVQKAYQYSSVFLLDPQGVVRMSVPERIESVAPVYSQFTSGVIVPE